MVFRASTGEFEAVDPKPGLRLILDLAAFTGSK